MILKAEIKGGKVYVGNNVVENITLLSEGKSDSQGFVLIDADKYFYITKTTDDLTKALDIVVNLIDALSNGILESNGGGAIISPTFIAELENIKQLVNDLKGNQV